MFVELLDKEGLRIDNFIEPFDDLVERLHNEGGRFNKTVESLDKDGLRLDKVMESPDGWVERLNQLMELFDKKG